MLLLLPTLASANFLSNSCRANATAYAVWFCVYVCLVSAFKINFCHIELYSLAKNCNTVIYYNNFVIIVAL